MEVVIGNELQRRPHAATPRIHGSVYGGGFMGRVVGNTHVVIGD